MRLWSIHPKYLDVRGLVALWREALLAQKVLMGQTKGYKNHPQLQRFKAQKDPSKAISVYLFQVYKEAQQRGYHFDKNKIAHLISVPRRLIKVNKGQLLYELGHLNRKLRKRDRIKLQANQKAKRILPHPLFFTVQGDVEAWEKRGDYGNRQ